MGNANVDLFNLYLELASDAAQWRRVRLRGGSRILMSCAVLFRPIAKTATGLQIKSTESQSPR